MAQPSEPRTLVLHALRLKGFADTPVVAAHARLSEDDAAGLLAKLDKEGLATRREGRITGWSLTATGRTAQADLAVAESDACRADIRAAYRDFLALNAEMLSVCTAWQMRTVGGEPVLNDHADAAYDSHIVDRLRTVDDKVQPVCARLAQCLARFEPYGGRLHAALEKVEAGDIDWFTKPVIDSYHTVWFELHEDLLCTLGIERSKEETVL